VDPDDVALAIAVEITHLLHAPAEAGTENDGAAAEAQPVHEPDGSAVVGAAATMLLPSPLKSAIV
jgi:hypothetical protein